MAGKKKESAVDPHKWEDVPEIPKEEQPYPLPERWKWVKLLNIAKWGSGGTPSRKHPEYYIGEIAWLKTGELEDNEIYLTEEHITQDAINNSSAKIFPINTVVMAMYGATIGKLGILKIEAATNQACACASCFNFIFYKYLFFYLLSQRDEFINLGKGGAQPNISQEVIKNYPLPLPPLKTQHHIVNRIESLFSKLDEAAEKVQAVIDSHEARKQAILHQAFSGELTRKWRQENGVSKDRWQQTTIGDILKVHSGTGLTSKHMSKHGKIPVYGGNGITGYHNQYNTKRGTIIIGRVGYYCGTVYILNENSWVTDNALIVENIVDNIDNEYLYLLLSFTNLQINNSATAQPVISGSKIYPIEINLAPYIEQKKIYKLAKELLEKNIEIEEDANNSIVLINNIKKNILHKCFNGSM